MNAKTDNRRREDFDSHAAAAIETTAQSTDIDHFNVTERLVAKYGRFTVTAAEAAREIGCHPSHIRAMCQNGAIYAIRFGSRWRIPIVSLASVLGSDCNGQA